MLEGGYFQNKFCVIFFLRLSTIFKGYVTDPQALHHLPNSVTKWNRFIPNHILKWNEIILRMISNGRKKGRILKDSLITLN